MTAKMASAVCAVVGLCLTISGWGFHYLDWPDAFKGIYTGPLVLVLGLALFLKGTATSSDTGNARIRQHTLLTYWPKYGTPAMFLLAIIASALMIQWGKFPVEMGMPLILSLLLLLMLSLVISYFLHFVYLTDEALLTKRYNTEVVYSRDAIKSIYCVFLILYVLETHDGIKRLFLPRLAQVQKDLFNF